MNLILAFGLLLNIAHASLTARMPVSLKLMTCELMLDPKLRDLSSSRNVRASLDYAIAHQSDPNLIKRWTEIRAALDEGNPDKQIVSLELRGEEIKDAEWMLVDRSFTLRQTYDAELKKQFHPVVDAGAAIFNVVVAYSLGGEMINLMSGNVTPEAVMGALAVPPWLGYNAAALHYHLARFDWSFNRLRREVAKNAEGSHPAALSSRHATIPADFHRGLMSRDGVDDDTRARAIQSYGGPLWFVNTLLLRSLQKMKERVHSANDVARGIHLDHIFYFDEEKKESVWLAFYRARRGRRFGGRRTTGGISAQDSTALGWSRTNQDRGR